ncbi:hypothetical protein ACFY1P_24120 [Streptomyces sp. NPDC001407]|uniref:hypothetical protein n=1 Tax=unclassified Streptomyces TaxID=2593676 RepID=UPI0036C8685C
MVGLGAHHHRPHPEPLGTQARLLGGVDGDERPALAEGGTTPLGEEVVALLTTLKEWPENHAGEVLAARAVFDARAAAAGALVGDRGGGQSEVRRRTSETKPQHDR